jgi:hypothetical protein
MTKTCDGCKELDNINLGICNSASAVDTRRCASICTVTNKKGIMYRCKKKVKVHTNFCSCHKDQWVAYTMAKDHDTDQWTFPDGIRLWSKQNINFVDQKFVLYKYTGAGLHFKPNDSKKTHLVMYQDIYSAYHYGIIEWKDSVIDDIPSRRYGSFLAILRECNVVPKVPKTRVILHIEKINETIHLKQNISRPLKHHPTIPRSKGPGRPPPNWVSPSQRVIVPTNV